MLLTGRVSGLIARPRPRHGVLSARVVSAAPAFDGGGRRESALEGGEGEGVAEQWGNRSRLLCSVQSNMGRLELFERHKI